MSKLKFVGTGTGRCGTVFLARYLTSIGVPCGHECFFNRDGIDQAAARLADPTLIMASTVSGNAWLPSGSVTAESSYMAAPFLDTALLEGVSVIHLIRNPLKVISSFVNALHYFCDPTKITTYERFIFHAIPDLYQTRNSLERACLFYLEWNQLIQEKSTGKPYLLHRIEDSWETVWKFVGSPVFSPDQVFQDTKVNTFPKVMIRLKEIPAGEIKDRFVDFSRQHGYLLDHGLFC